MKLLNPQKKKKKTMVKKDFDYIAINFSSRRMKEEKKKHLF